MKPNRARIKTRFAIRHARSVRLGIRDLIDIEEVLTRWFGLYDPIGDQDQNNPVKITGNQARDWARMNIPIKSTERLENALARIYADAYILGEDITAYELARLLRITKAVPSKKQLARARGIDWSKWSPGNRAAAALVRPPNGLRRLLERRGVTIRGLSRTTVDRLGTRLADALQQGLSRRATAKLLDEVLNDAERALAIAGTEMTYAVTQASKDLYRESGVEMVEWLVADPCDDCQENYDQSPIPIGEEWRNGEPPVHPNCMCDIAPYVVDTVSWAEVYGEDAE